MIVGGDNAREECNDFKQGRCMRGALCRFNHGPDDDRDMAAVDRAAALRPHTEVKRGL